MLRSWKDSDVLDTSESRSYSSSVQQRHVSNGIRSSSSGTPHMTLYNTVIEEKIIIEQVDTSESKYAEQLRVSIEEKYKHWSTTVQDLLHWLKSVEKQLTAQEPIRESPEELKQQISSLKLIHDDLWSHSDDVSSTLVQIRQLVTEGTSVISAQNLSTLEEYGNQLKTRYDRAESSADQLLHKATTAYEELTKYTTEKNVFSDWLKVSCRTLVEIEKKIETMSFDRPERLKEFVSDVISHKAELRFLEMTANRFADTAQDYLAGLNDIRVKLSQRLPALRKKPSRVQEEYGEISSVYSDLLSRTNKLFDSLEYRTRQKEFQTKVDEAIGWLKAMTPRIQKLIDEPLRTKPREAEDQLRRAKGLIDEITSNRTLINAVSIAGKNLVLELPAAEGAAVQKTCKDIEDRYEDLLSNANTKVRELESGATLISKIDDNLKAIRSILEREESRLPSNTIGTSAREAAIITQTLQQILRVLDENTGLMDTTRSFINELLRKGQGNEALRSDFVQLQDRWGALEKTAKERLNLSDFIGKFFDLHKSLSSWLDDKDKILNSLDSGTDVNRAVVQLQQLKSLRDDFKAHHPKLNELNSTGENVLHRANASVSERHGIEDALSTINQRWNDLLRQIDEKKSNTQALLDAREEFDKNFNRIEAALRKINTELDTLDHDKTKLSPETLIHQIKALERSLSSQTVPIAALEDAGKNLIDILPDWTSKTDVKNKLAGVGRHFDQCSKKLEALRNALEAFEKQAQDFNDACADTQKWVDSMLSQLDNVSISADRDILKDQVTSYERICSEILSRKSEIQKLNQQGKEFESHGSGPILQLLQQSWNTLEKEATSTRSRLNKCYDHCLKYDKNYQSFLTWLISSENKLDGIKLNSLKKSDVERSMRDINDLKKECSRRTSEYTETDSLGNTFLSACDRDKEGVRGELQDLKERWDRLNHATKCRIQHLEDLNEKLRTFNENVDSTKKAIGKCDGELETTLSPTKLKAIGEEVGQLGKALDGLKRKGFAICRLAEEDECDTDMIPKAIDDLYDRLFKLKSKFDSCSDKLDEEQKALAACLEKFKGISSNLAGLESEFDGMKPAGRDIPTVEDQIRTMSDFTRRLRNEQDEFEYALRHVEQLGVRGTENSRLKSHMEELRKKFVQLSTKAGTRSSELDAMLKRLQDFYQLYKNADNDLNGLLQKVALLDSAQALDDLRRKGIAPTGKKIDEVNSLGRGLIKSAGPSVNTKLLETDLEKLNNKWKELNEKIAEKRRILENQQQREKEFGDTIAQFQASLKQLDHMIVDDGRVHGDLDTVKSLVHQHKKAEDQLSNRRSQLQSIVKIAADLMDSTTVMEEKSKVSKQVLSAKEAFQRIEEKCDRRSKKLDEALRDAEKLNSSVHSLLDWLTTAERRRKTFPEPSSQTDEGNAIKLLEEHEKFQREIERKESEKNATLEFAREILSKAHPNAVAIIKAWISSIESKWSELWNWALKRREKLEDLITSLRESSDALKELLAWLKKREETLKKVEMKTLPNNVDELLVLIRDHNDFMELVDGRERDINSACGTNQTGGRKHIKGSSPRAKSPSPSKDKLNLFPRLGPAFEKISEPTSSGNAVVRVVWMKWKDVWTLCWERQARLERKYDDLMRKFDWDDWKKRFLKYMNYNKDRIKDLFTKLDRRNTGHLPRNKFIDSIVNTAFPTTDSEMSAVADMFDNGEDETDYMRFLAALRAEWAEKKVLPEATLINNEIQRQVARCTCKQRFRVEQVAEGTYRFGESQKLRLVRILRSTVMVRVGGGWVTLEEFLTKNDPCRMKGRTNVELREQLNTPEGAAHIMAAFTAKRRGDRNASKSHSPSPVRQPQKGIWKDRSKF